MFIKSDANMAGLTFNNGEVISVNVMGFKRGEVLFTPRVSSDGRN